MMFQLAAEWGSVALDVLAWLLPILGALLTLLLPQLLKKLIDKMGLERSKEIDALIDKYVKQGVDYAERFARLKLDGRELKSGDKLSLAVRTVLKELEQSGIRGVTEDLIKARIESYLELKEPAGN
jgi:hypothetical protein